jgi:hypothetical protein
MVGRMIRLIVGGGALVGEIAMWSPAVQALALLGVIALLLIINSSDDRTRRLIDVIDAWRGGPANENRARSKQPPPGSGLGRQDGAEPPLLLAQRPPDQAPTAAPSSARARARVGTLATTAAARAPSPGDERDQLAG